MAENPLYACQRAIVTALKASDAAWGDRVRLNNGKAGWEYPYVVFAFSGGGEGNRIRARSADAMIVMVVKAISDSQDAAARSNEQIADRLNDMGVQDVSSGALDAGPGWYILTSTREDYISYEERISETSAIYHEGARYRFIMEAQ